MTTRTFKLRELSDLFCDADGVHDQEERDRRYSQMRLLSQKKLFKPDGDDISRGKVARYAIGEACLARLYARMYEIGISFSVLRDVEHNLRRKLKTTSEGLDPSAGRGNRSEREVGSAHLDTVLAAIERGERWVFEVTLKRNDRGDQIATARFRPENEPSSFSRDRVPDLFGKPKVETPGDTVVLQATDLLSPVIRAEPEG